MGQLTSVELVKQALKIPAGITVHDAGIAQLVEQADTEILKECTGLTQILATTYSGYFEGYGTKVAMIDPWPVFAVVAVTAAGQFVSPDDYDWKTYGGLKRYDDVWPEGRKALHVTFVAGLVAVAGQTAADLVGWATLHAARRYYISWMAGMKEEDVKPIRRRVADPTLEEDAVLREIAVLASRYRRA